MQILFFSENPVVHKGRFVYDCLQGHLEPTKLHLAPSKNWPLLWVVSHQSHYGGFLCFHFTDLFSFAVWFESHWLFSFSLSLPLSIALPSPVSFVLCVCLISTASGACHRCPHGDISRDRKDTNWHFVSDLHTLTNQIKHLRTLTNQIKHD